MRRLHHQIALITGAADGTGAVVVRAFVAEGATDTRCWPPAPTACCQAARATVRAMRTSLAASIRAALADAPATSSP
jgi:NAD(P)-dependent dehydrogenase (short-subunit alcohol dehydrogenase family)